jgi:hypothetical protein
MWYSLDDSQDTERVEDYADALFSAKTHNRLEYGNHWVSYVQNAGHVAAYQPQVNLLLVLSAQPASIFDPSGSGVFAFTLLADVGNSGNTRLVDAVEVTFWDGPPGAPRSQRIGSTQVVSDISGCGGYRSVEVTWPNRSQGPNTWYVRVQGAPGETRTADNIASAYALVTSSRVHLPLLLKAN